MSYAPCTFQILFFGNSASAFHFQRPALDDAHAPMRDVEVVRPPAGNHAEGVVLVAQPAGPRLTEFCGCTRCSV